MIDEKKNEEVKVVIDDFEFEMSKENAEYTEKNILVKNQKFFTEHKNYDLLDLFEDAPKE